MLFRKKNMVLLCPEKNILALGLWEKNLEEKTQPLSPQSPPRPPPPEKQMVGP